jgi:adenylate cyclase
MIEIERKFLQDDSFKAAAFAKNQNAQGYLSSVLNARFGVRKKAKRIFDHKRNFK